MNRDELKGLLSRTTRDRNKPKIIHREIGDLFWNFRISFDLLSRRKDAKTNVAIFKMTK